jgi:hypothetical protein
MVAEPSQAERDAAVPARHVDRRVRKPGANVDRETGEMLPDIPTLMEVERRILACDTHLGELVVDYADLTENAARAKAEWEEHRDRTILRVANQGERTSEDVRLATAKLATSARGVPGEELYRTYLICAAAADSCGKALYAVQARLSAQQTLVKGLRQVTGMDL